MNVYCLMHFHGETADVYGDAKWLGCFSSLEAVKEAKARYLTLPGFGEYPEGFCVIEREISGEFNANCENVYLSEVYIHDDRYSFEYELFIGLFGTQLLAEESMAKFQKQNSSFAFRNGKELVVECFVSRCKLNQMEWREGFDAD